MTGHDLERALQVAVELAGWACETIRGASGTGTGPTGPVREKASPADIVTDTDEKVETHVRTVLRREFPDWGIEGEEYGAEELMIVTITHSHRARRRSYELIADAFALARTKE